jgi:hypothetical protein
MRDPKDITHNGKTLEEWLEINKTENAYLRDADLRDADLRGAYLRGADLRGADLRGAYLRGADLRGADLRGADLRDADLRDADLRGAYLRGADLSDADLRDADLRGAYLRGADLSEYQKAMLSILPDEGDIIGWKKCENDVIVKLRIPSNARRSNATGRKCRAEFAEVLEVIGAEEGVSTYDQNVRYRVCETVKCDEWNDDRWVECGGGIHFFITRAEAENY